MKLIPATLAAALLGASTLVAAAADEVQLEGAKAGHWTMDFDAAVKEAAAKNLPLMLNFTGSDWCGWCKLMDEKVFAQEEWRKFAAENVMLVTLDFPRDKSIVPEKYVERNNTLKEQFGVRGYPTYIVLDSDGETRIGKLGAGRDKTPASFIEEFKAVARLSAGSIEAYAKANPDKADAYKAAIAESRAAQKALDEWIATKPERNDENTQLFEELNARIKAADEALESF